MSLVVPAVLVVLLAGCATGSGAEPGGPDPTAAPTAAPEQGARTGLRYVALGDSYTAAPGLPGAALPCLRSAENYPSLVAGSLGEPVVLDDRSCVGADTSSLTQPQRLGGSRLPPQLDALDARTDLVTLSMGGNDEALFVRLLSGCLSLAADDPDGSPCADADAASPLASVLPTIQQRLVDAVEEVRRRAPSAQVLLVGYPQLVPARGGCPDRLPLAAGDVGFARGVNRALADAVEAAAAAAGAGYVDLWRASRGHDVCADEPWVNGAGVDPSGAIPFHPLPVGQRATADLVVAEVG